MTRINLQRFAETTPTGKNNNIGPHVYTKQFKELLKAVFNKKSYFTDFFAGGLEAIDGVSEADEAFTIKSCDTAVVTGTYSTTSTDAMSTGTAKSSRFGTMTEIKYATTKAEYTWNWAFHEGIDRFTVNYPEDEAVADRLNLIAQAKVAQFNKKHGKFISDNAGATITTSATALAAADVKSIFNELSKKFNNLETIGTRHAKVNSDLYNLLVDDALSVTSKNSSVNIDENGIVKFKGFVIEEVPDDLFQTGEVAYAYIEGVAKAYTGINTIRTVEAIDFDGLQIQGAGKAGEYIPTDNKAAVIKVKLKSA